MTKSVTEGYAGPVPKRFVAVDSAADRDYNAGLGLRAHLALGEPRGVELAADLLREMGVPHHEIAAWIEDLSERRGFLASADEADRAEVA